MFTDVLVLAMHFHTFELNLNYVDVDWTIIGGESTTKLSIGIGVVGMSQASRPK